MTTDNDTHDHTHDVVDPAAQFQVSTELVIAGLQQQIADQALRIAVLEARLVTQQ